MRGEEVSLRAASKLISVTTLETPRKYDLILKIDFFCKECQLAISVCVSTCFGARDSMHITLVCTSASISGQLRAAFFELQDVL